MQVKLRFLRFFVVPQMRPSPFLKQPKLSSRADESSIFNIFKKMKEAKIAALRLQFLKDVPHENTIFD